MDSTYGYGNVSRKMATSRGHPPHLYSYFFIAFYTFPRQKVSQGRAMDTMNNKNLFSANGWLLQLRGEAEMDIEDRFSVV